MTETQYQQYMRTYLNTEAVVLSRDTDALFLKKWLLLCSKPGEQICGTGVPNSLLFLSGRLQRANNICTGMEQSQNAPVE